MITPWSGKSSGECRVGRIRFAYVLRQICEIKTVADFDWVRAAEVETWIRDVLAEGRGLNGPDFTETEVTAAFEKLKQCVYAIDGLSRKYVFSLLKVLLVLLQFS
mgnify:CR=1 FL=1